MKIVLAILIIKLCYGNILCNCEANAKLLLPSEYHSPLYSDFIGVDIESSQCGRIKRICCKNTLFEIFTIKISRYLHVFTGIASLENDINLFKLELINYIMATLENNLSRLNPTKHSIFDECIRARLYNLMFDSLTIKSQDGFNVTSIVTQCLIKKYNKSTNHKWVQLLSHKRLAELNGVLKEIYHQNFFNLLYHLQKLSEFVVASRMIGLSSSCTEQLKSMIFCGVCSGSYDWSKYLLLNSTYESSSSTGICSEFCYTTIRQCVSWLFLLDKIIAQYCTSMKLYLYQQRAKLLQLNPYWLIQTYKEFSLIDVANKIHLIYNKNINNSITDNKIIRNNEQTNHRKEKKVDPDKIYSTFIRLVDQLNQLGARIKMLCYGNNIYQSNGSSGHCWNGTSGWSTSNSQQAQMLKDLSSPYWQLKLLLYNMITSIQKPRHNASANNNVEGSGQPQWDDEDFFSMTPTNQTFDSKYNIDVFVEIPKQRIQLKEKNLNKASNIIFADNILIMLSLANLYYFQLIN